MLLGPSGSLASGPVVGGMSRETAKIFVRPYYYDHSRGASPIGDIGDNGGFVHNCGHADVYRGWRVPLMGDFRSLSPIGKSYVLDRHHPRATRPMAVGMPKTVVFQDSRETNF